MVTEKDLEEAIMVVETIEDEEFEPGQEEAALAKMQKAVIALATALRGYKNTASDLYKEAQTLINRFSAYLK